MFKSHGLFSCKGFLEKSFGRAARRIHRMECRIYSEIKLSESISVHISSYNLSIKAPSCLDLPVYFSYSYEKKILVDLEMVFSNRFGHMPLTLYFTNLREPNQSPK